MIRTARDDREETRRIKTADLLLEWSKSQNRDTSFSVRFLESLSAEQCERLYWHSDIELTDEQAGYYLRMFPEQDLIKSEDGAGHRLTESQIMNLRWNAIYFLNQLESIMTAWRIGILDHDTIVQQFEYLYNPNRGSNALREFRIAAGGDRAYPNIEILMREIKQRQQKMDNDKR